MLLNREVMKGLAKQPLARMTELTAANYEPRGAGNDESERY